jgi:hypothetical protein
VSDGTRYNLTEGSSSTLDSSGAGQVTLGPDAGPANWHVTGLIVQTNRPGQAPIPRVQLYLNEVDPSNSLGLNYDGSFAQASGDQQLSRGQRLIAVWSGGQAGDVATLTVNGEKWN